MLTLLFDVYTSMSLLCLRIFILNYANLGGPKNIKKPDIIQLSVEQANIWTFYVDMRLFSPPFF